MGSPNREVLRAVARWLGNVGLVKQVNTFPPNKSGTVEAIFDATMYPESVTEVYLDVELLLNGEFFVHYVENWSGDRRECRWDRHENDHNDRDHYHPFPSASTSAAADRPYPEEFFAVIREVLRDIEQRWSETFDQVGG